MPGDMLQPGDICIRRSLHLLLIPQLGDQLGIIYGLGIARQQLIQLGSFFRSGFAAELSGKEMYDPGVHSQ